MLRISEGPPSHHGVTLRLEGRMTGPWVDEARQACEGILTSGCALTLDLGEVEFLDANGAALLARLRSRGVSLVACSPFVEARLQAPLDSAS
jgi:anti-anti-sigma regulatory factor